jgi:hypothetical protein
LQKIVVTGKGKPVELEDREVAEVGKKGKCCWVLTDFN